MTDVLMLPVSILTQFSLRKESGFASLERMSAGECRALPFFDFRHCLTMFSFHSFAPLIRYWNGYTIIMVDLLLWRQRSVEKKQKIPAFFAISVMIPCQPTCDH